MYVIFTNCGCSKTVITEPQSVDDAYFEIDVHLNTEFCNIDYNRITITAHLIRTPHDLIRRADFTLYGDSAKAHVDSLIEGIWNIYWVLYQDSTRLASNYSAKIDISPDMLNDIYFDYLMPGREQLESQIYSIIVDYYVDRYRTVEGNENKYCLVLDSSECCDWSNEIKSSLLYNQPTIKTSTLVDYYQSNWNSEPIILSNPPDKFELINLPDDWNWSDIKDLRSTRPDALGSLIFTRVGFSPSFNQAIVYLKEVWEPLFGYGSIIYLEKINKEFRLIREFGMWVS